MRDDLKRRKKLNKKFAKKLITEMNDAQWKIADAAVKKMEREGTSKAGKAITAELF